MKFFNTKLIVSCRKKQWYKERRKINKEIIDLIISRPYCVLEYVKEAKIKKQ